MTIRFCTISFYTFSLCRCFFSFHHHRSEQRKMRFPWFLFVLSVVFFFFFSIQYATNSQHRVHPQHAQVTLRIRDRTREKNQRIFHRLLLVEECLVFSVWLFFDLHRCMCVWVCCWCRIGPTAIQCRYIHIPMRCVSVKRTERLFVSFSYRLYRISHNRCLVITQTYTPILLSSIFTVSQCWSAGSLYICLSLSSSSSLSVIHAHINLHHIRNIDVLFQWVNSTTIVREWIRWRKENNRKLMCHQNSLSLLRSLRTVMLIHFVYSIIGGHNTLVSFVLRTWSDSTERYRRRPKYFALTHTFMHSQPQFNPLHSTKYTSVFRHVYSIPLNECVLYLIRSHTFVSSSMSGKRTVI